MLVTMSAAYVSLFNAKRSPLLLGDDRDNDILPQLPLLLIRALSPLLLNLGIKVPPELVRRLDDVVPVCPALPRLVEDVVQDLHVLILPQPCVAGPHRLEGVVCVGQRLPLAAVNNSQQILIEEEHLGHIGMRVHGINQLVILLLGRLQNHGAAVE